MPSTSSGEDLRAAQARFYPRKGYTETHREERDGYHRVHFSKSLG